MGISDFRSYKRLSRYKAYYSAALMVVMALAFGFSGATAFAGPDATKSSGHQHVHRDFLSNDTLRSTWQRGIDLPSPTANKGINSLTQKSSTSTQVTKGGGEIISNVLQNNSGTQNQSSSGTLAVESFPATHRVVGRFRYQRPISFFIDSNVTLAPWLAEPLYHNQDSPIERAVVVLTDGCGHYIRKELSHDGFFWFNWTPAGCEIASVTVWSVSDSNKIGVGRWLGDPVESLDDLTTNTEDYRAYSFTRNFAIDDAERPGELDLGNILVPAYDSATRGFTIMANVERALTYLAEMDGVSRADMPKINVEHTINLKPGHMSCNDGDWGAFLRTGIYLPNKDIGYIHIPWDCRDMGFDSHVHIHEVSHYFQRLFLRSNPDYGRFQEGFANLQSAMIRGSRWITAADPNRVENLDVNSRMACWDGQSWASVIDNAGQHDECVADGNTPGFPQAALWNDTLASSGWFQRIVYDLIDAGATLSEPVTQFSVDGAGPAGDCGNACEFGQFDIVDGNPDMLNDVVTRYLGGKRNILGENPYYTDNGLEGIDLIDLLDGMVCRGHIDGPRIELLMSTMGFDYDSLSAPSSCPHPYD